MTTAIPDTDFHGIRPCGQPAFRSNAFEELASILIEQGIAEWPPGVDFDRFGNPDGGREGRGVALGCDPIGLSLSVVTADSLHCHGAAEFTSAGGPARTLTPQVLPSDGRPRCSATPVATRTWLEMLGPDGGEERGELLV